MTTAPTLTLTIETIQLKRSGAAGVVPTALARGEPFINLADGLMLIGDGVSAPADLPRFLLITQANITALVSVAMATLYAALPSSPGGASHPRLWLNGSGDGRGTVEYS